jgi:hypothetical protein
MPSKKELAAMQKLIDDFDKPTPVADSNTKAQSEAEQFLGAMGMAEDEAKRRMKIKKLTGN